MQNLSVVVVKPRAHDLNHLARLEHFAAWIIQMEHLGSRIGAQDLAQVLRRAVPDHAGELDFGALPQGSENVIRKVGVLRGLVGLHRRRRRLAERGLRWADKEDRGKSGKKNVSSNCRA
jgi:hypothetical protein